MKKIEIRKSNGSKRVFTINEEPSMTDQSFGPEVEVNNIMNQYLKTGQITHLAKSQGVFSDLSDLPDFATALNTVTQAQQAFDQLPSDLRERFGNSPEALMNFIHDENNYDEGVKLGLFNPREQDLTSTKTDQSVKKEKAKKTNDDSNDNN